MTSIPSISRWPHREHPEVVLVDELVVEQRAIELARAVLEQVLNALLDLGDRLGEGLVGHPAAQQRAAASVSFSA